MRTVREVMQENGLDFEVEKYEVPFTNPITGKQQIHGRLPVIRKDNGDVVGYVSKNFQLIQNDKSFAVFDELAKKGEIEYGKAGIRSKGGIIWLQAKLPWNIEIIPGDKSDVHLLVLNGHGTGYSYNAMLTTIRLWCENQMRYAFRNSLQTVRIQHIGDVSIKLDKLRQTIESARKRSTEIEDEARRLHETQVSVDDVEDFFMRQFPVENDQLNDLALDGVSQTLLDKVIQQTRDVSRETTNNARALQQIVQNYNNERQLFSGGDHSMWLAFNAITKWTDHQRRTRGSTDSERQQNRLNSSWFGAGQKIKQDAYRLALQTVRN